jgi:zinc protease
MTTAITERNVRAAPRRPAGIHCPHRDGERDIDGLADDQRYRIGAKAAASSFFPVIIRGETPGRRMRGGADVNGASIPQFDRHGLVLGFQA